MIADCHKCVNLGCSETVTVFSHVVLCFTLCAVVLVCWQMLSSSTGVLLVEMLLKIENNIHFNFLDFYHLFIYHFFQDYLMNRKFKITTFI